MTTTIQSKTPTITKDNLGLVPLWDYLGWEQTKTDNPNWDCVKSYCDLETKDTVCIWEGGDGLTNNPNFVPCGDFEVPGDYDYCGYIWKENGESYLVDTTDGMLWWCIDDMIYGPFFLGYIDENNHLMTGEEKTIKGMEQGFYYVHVQPDPLYPWGDYFQ